MNYSSIIMGIICSIVGIFIHPLAKKRLQDDEINHLTLKGYIISFLLVIMGFILVAMELAKII